MKNVSSLKATKSETPKTPGGISKSLLTPCRRVGLSRNWRKGGPSPFVSPLPGSGETKQEKRKIDDVDSEKCNNTDDINTTPSRNVALPKRKKSKILSAKPESPITNVCENEESTSGNVIQSTPTKVKLNEDSVVTPVLESKSEKCILSEENTVTKIDVVTPVIKSKSTCKEKQDSDSNVTLPSETVAKPQKKISIKLEKSKKKSPQNLTKECVIVIQKKIFKKVLPQSQKDQNVQKVTSQTLFDSDSDDVPLCQLNKTPNNDCLTEKPDVVEKNAQIQPRVLVLNEDDDFIETDKAKVHKLEDKTTSTTTLKKTVKKITKENKKLIIKEPIATSQSSDDDDFDFDHKRTILVRKSYDKVTKPLKAKSTGSITQSDIDELRSRIEVKKKLLLAKAMSNDTEELRGLIKKWQKGCQDALSELMDMMRNKFLEKQNMDFSELLQTLKIPSNLVGYDEENDCFNTPDDRSIVLSKFNDI